MCACKGNATRLKLRTHTNFVEGESAWENADAYGYGHCAYAWAKVHTSMHHGGDMYSLPCELGCCLLPRDGDHGSNVQEHKRG